MEELNFNGDSEYTPEFRPDAYIIPMITDKKVPFRQTTPAGCGSYCLANLFNRARFIGKLPEKGERTIDLNMKLLHSGIGLAVETFWLTLSSIERNRLEDKSVLDVQINDDSPDAEELREYGARPLLMIVNKPKTKLFHYILILHNLRVGMFHIVDSNQDNIVFLPPEHLIEHYWIVGLEYFTEIDGEDTNEYFIDKRDFPHLFGPND